MNSYKISYFKIFIIFGVLSITGISLIPYLNIKLNPQKASNYLYINFQYPQASPQAIEKNITSRLEGIAALIKGIEQIDSETSQGSGTITLKINDDYDLKRFKLLLNASIRESWKNFPKGMPYPTISLQNTKKVETTLMSYKLTSSLDMPDIKNWIENELSPDLLRINGAEKITYDGIFSFEVHVKINQDKIRNLGISLEEIQQSISDIQKTTDIYPFFINNKNLTRQFILRIYSPKNNINELPKIPVKLINEKIIYLDDIATVDILKSESNSIYRINGDKCVFIRIIADENVNNIKLARKYRNFFKAYKQQIPKNINISLASDSTQFIRDELIRIGFRTLLTLILILGTLWFVYKDKNYIIFIIITFITNIAIACSLYYFLNIEIHFFAMAGITLSFGMMIDNSIIVIDYIKTRNNIKIILPLFAATFTTIGALYIINIVPVQKEGYWYDFTMVIIINLSISLLSSLILIPSLTNKYGLKQKSLNKDINKRNIVKINNLYLKYINWSIRNKAYVFIIFAFLFGIPFFALPKKMNNKIIGSKYYNKIFQNETFNEDIRPWIDKITGGTLKPFIEHTQGQYHVKIPKEDAIIISVHSQPEYTFEHLNSLFNKLEINLKRFKAIKQTESILSPNKTGQLIIRFKKEINNNQPYITYNYIVDFLQEFCKGADWNLAYKGLYTSITNKISSSKPWGFYLYGYDYEKLFKIAQNIKMNMYKDPRVKDISIIPKSSIWGKSSGTSTIFVFNSGTEVNKSEVINNLDQINSQTDLKQINYRNNYVPLLLSNQSNKSFYDFFNLYFPKINKKIATLGTLKEIDNPQEIIRHNQQYQLFVEYNYLSSAKLALNYQNSMVANLNMILPPGFSAETNFSRDNTKTSWLLPISLIIIFIFFITSILLESLMQALYVLFMIPFSYIGVFITFQVFNIDFDQGGYASFLLLGGTTVNSAIYIINVMNHNIKKNPLLNYIKSWNIMFTPILLTTFSTILGFIPFIFGQANDAFWKAFSCGTIGGLIFSMIGIILLLPLQLKRKPIISNTNS